MGFKFNFQKGDFWGGLTAGIVALPLALAFGVSSGLGPSAGLYGAIFLSIFAALFGGTATQISGPTAPMTAVSMLIIAGIVGANNGNVEQALPSILFVFFAAGLIQILFGFIGIGQYVKFIPYPVLSGFMTAIGIMIISSQIFPTIGYSPSEDKELVQSYMHRAEESMIKKTLNKDSEKNYLLKDNLEKKVSLSTKISDEEIYNEAKNIAKSESSGTIGTLKLLPKALKKINLTELLITISTLFLIYGFKRITKKIPSTLVALILISGLVYFLDIKYLLIKEIPLGFPNFQHTIFTQFEWMQIQPYILASVSLALLGTIDSLLTSIVADNLTKTKHNSNKELIGQGIGNSISSLFGGLPGAGATIRTVVNIDSGGKTRVSGMISGLVLLLILILLAPIASKIPAAVLAGILISVGISVMDYKGLSKIKLLPKDINLKFFKLSSEFIIMISVMLIAVVFDLVIAVGIGLIIASLLFINKMSDYAIKQSKVFNLTIFSHFLIDNSVESLEKYKSDILEKSYVQYLRGPLFFGYQSDLEKLSKDIPEDALHVILFMKKVPYVDQSGLNAIENIIKDFEKRGIVVSIVAVKPQPKMYMENMKLIPNCIPENRVFSDMNSFHKWLLNNEK